MRIPNSNQYHADEIVTLLKANFSEDLCYIRDGIVSLESKASTVNIAVNNDNSMSLHWIDARRKPSNKSDSSYTIAFIMLAIVLAVAKVIFHVKQTIWISIGFVVVLSIFKGGSFNSTETKSIPRENKNQRLKEISTVLQQKINSLEDANQ